MKLPNIVERMYELNRWLISKVSHFSKDQRYLLGARLQNKGLDIQDQLITAALMPKSQSKIKLLQAARNGLEQMRFLVRLCKDQKYFSSSAYHYCSKKVIEIAKVLGSWIKSISPTSV